MPSILVIDDDLDLCDLVAEFLLSEGFDITVANDGQSGLELIKADNPDLIVMDVMMPVMGGFEVLKQIRELNIQLPVIMLTARGDDIDKILGLELGADDYLAKPFNPRELIARIKAILRRSSYFDLSGNLQLCVEDLVVNPNSRQAFIDQIELDLTAAEFDILHLLLKSAGEVCSKETLTEQGLSRKLEMYDRSIDMHISNLRKKLGAKPDGTTRIKTVRGIGYLYAVND